MILYTSLKVIIHAYSRVVHLRCVHRASHTARKWNFPFIPIINRLLINMHIRTSGPPRNLYSNRPLRESRRKPKRSRVIYGAARKPTYIHICYSIPPTMARGRTMEDRNHLAREDRTGNFHFDALTCYRLLLHGRGSGVVCYTSWAIRLPAGREETAHSNHRGESIGRI